MRHALLICVVTAVTAVWGVEPVWVLDVDLPDRAALAEITAVGGDIDAVRGDSATVYVTGAVRDRLDDLGYRYRVIERQPSALKSLTGYSTYEGVASALADLAAAHPDLCRLTSLGVSVQGRDLWALRISDYPDIREDEPELRLIAAMHGDEPLGTELCLELAKLLLEGNGVDARLTDLVNETAIWIVPLMNPDGREMNWRYNAGSQDLNRAFPAYPWDFTGTVLDGGPLGDAGRPPEVQHVMRWAAQHHFVLAANLHTGALVVNYPYDDDGKGSVDSPTPDDLLLEEISRRYSRTNPPMWASPYFPDGITNGAAWYSVSGGMQDWHYRYLGCLEVTIEQSDIKRPPVGTLPQFWQDNRESMLTFIESAHLGVRGVVTDSVTGEPVYAQVLVQGNAQPVFTHSGVGNYHRLLLPGSYDLTVTAPGYEPFSATGVEVGEGPAARLDVHLVREQDSTAWDHLNQDADGDGYSNLHEILAGTNPDDPNDFPVEPLPVGSWALILLTAASLAACGARFLDGTGAAHRRHRFFSRPEC